jgi:hypothetical protein
MIPTPEEAAEALSNALNDDTRELRSWKELFIEAFRERDRTILDAAVLVVNDNAEHLGDALHKIVVLRNKVLGA